MRSSHRGQSTASHRPTRPQAGPHRLQLPQAPLTPPHTPVQVVSEYGTHWNFFFTLALVAAAAGVATPATPQATALCACGLRRPELRTALCGVCGTTLSTRATLQCGDRSALTEVCLYGTISFCVA